MQDIQVSSGLEMLSSGQDRAQVNRCPTVPGQFRTAGSEFRTGQGRIVSPCQRSRHAIHKWLFEGLIKDML